MKREKRLIKSIESLKKQIEEHFEKLDKEITQEEDITARYHIKELDKSLIFNLERKMEILGKTDKVLLESYRSKLEYFKELLFE